MKNWNQIGLGILMGTLLAATSASADERLFGYTTLSDSILPKNATEMEQWATIRSGKDTGKFAAWKLRTEFEYGITETLTGAIYINSTSEYSSGVADRDNTDSQKFDGLSFELKQMALSRELNPFGVMPYLEVTYSGKEFELEEKLILDRNIAPNWVWGLNIITEQEWEYTAAETESASAINFNSGISYQINPNWWIGLEGSQRNNYSGLYKTATRSALFVGPSVHFGTDKFQITASILKQTTQVYDEFESLEARIITAITF